jgi:hypothetical protein
MELRRFQRRHHRELLCVARDANTDSDANTNTNTDSDANSYTRSC